uniref:EF-hand domain-containing protein n=1 Tax=Panagrolaimus sp. JU765 TaxID=591449 RepID=A0AC34QBT5_9BILA
MSKATKKKSGKKRASGSEAAQFDQKTIQEFKEAFGIMDQNKDGIIDKGDLKDLYASMGQIASDAQIDAMLKEAPGPINFTVFLTLFGERLTGTDPEPTIVGAFQMFDKKDCGFLTEDELLKILKNRRGEPLDDEEIKAMYKGKPPIADGKALFLAERIQSVRQHLWRRRVGVDSNAPESFYFVFTSSPYFRIILLYCSSKGRFCCRIALILSIPLKLRTCFAVLAFWLVNLPACFSFTVVKIVYPHFRLIFTSNIFILKCQSLQSLSIVILKAIKMLDN